MAMPISEAGEYRRRNVAIRRKVVLAPGQDDVGDYL